ncbi:pentapeptide repeat-containing protein [Trichothermofontia sp.]
MMESLEPYYRVLGLEPGASAEEVNQAYKDLVFIWHPDRLPKDNPRLQQKAHAKLKEINQARDKLRSLSTAPVKRQSANPTSPPHRSPGAASGYAAQGQRSASAQPRKQYHSAYTGNYYNSYRQTTWQQPHRPHAAPNPSGAASGSPQASQPTPPPGAPAANGRANPASNGTANHGTAHHGTAASGASPPRTATNGAAAPGVGQYGTSGYESRSSPLGDEGSQSPPRRPQVNTTDPSRPTSPSQPYPGHGYQTYQRPPYTPTPDSTAAHPRPRSRPQTPDLSGADLQGVNWCEKYLEGRNLSHANLSRANLSDAFLHRINLSGANLSQANLFRANLLEADLSHANLQEANLIGADLSGADLRGADFTGAKMGVSGRLMVKLTGARLQGAILPDGSVHD